MLADPIAELREGLVALTARVDALEHHRAPQDDDAALMRAIAGAVGPLAFSGGEVVRHQAVDGDLRSALAAAGIRNARQLGRRLARWERRVDGGSPRLVRIGADRDGSVWLFRSRV